MNLISARARPARTAPSTPSAAHRPPASRSAGLQQLRFVAAFLVRVHHALEECSVRPDLPVSGALVRLGASGVDLFFVISGFVIWRTTGALGAGTTAGAFMARRLRRVLPLYWLVLGLVVVLWATGLAFRRLPATPTSLVASVLLLPPPGGRPLVLGVAWTLVYEMYFYALCALALCIPRPRNRPLALVAMLALVPALLGALGAASASDCYGNPIVLEFVFGGLIARHADALGRWPGAVRAAMAAAGVAGLVAACWLLPADGTAGLSASVRWWGWGVPAALIVGAGVAGLRVPDRAGGRALAALGDGSYALYLTHGFVMVALARVLAAGAAPDAGATLALGTLAVLAAVAVGQGVHAGVERPLLRWLDARRVPPGVGRHPS